MTLTKGSPTPCAIFETPNSEEKEKITDLEGSKLCLERRCMMNKSLSKKRGIIRKICGVSLPHNFQDGKHLKTRFEDSPFRLDHGSTTQDPFMFLLSEFLDTTVEHLLTSKHRASFKVSWGHEGTHRFGLFCLQHQRTISMV